MKKERLIEVTAQDIASVKSAIKGGADRIELCTALGVAGLTPSIGLVKEAVKIAKKHDLKGFVDVLIRPREGDFIYNEDELKVSIKNIKEIVKAGADGVVVGVLNKEGKIAENQLSKLIEAAGEATVVFNRAFDVVEDQYNALEVLIRLGVKRVLTSGGASKTINGLTKIEELVKISENRIEIMAGGGVRVEDIPILFDKGVNAIHTSAKKKIIGGNNRPGERAGHYQADQKNVELAVNAAKIN